MITINHCFIHDLLIIMILHPLIALFFLRTIIRHCFYFNVNIRSLPKNIDKLSHFISELKSYPDLIVIMETKLKQDKNYVNINLDGSNFMHNDSKTNATGVGIYIKDNIEYEIIKQINLDLNDTKNL